MRRLLVNDCLTCLPGTRTFWHDLMEWFDMQPVLAPYEGLAHFVETWPEPASLIIRNATWFPPIQTQVPTISLLQDILEGPQKEMQFKVLASSRAVVFNSAFTAFHYSTPAEVKTAIIPLPVDFSLFEPQNAMGCQQALSLPDGCVCWIGASQGAAGQVKGFDIFRSVVRANPDIPFVGVFKDAAPDQVPPNLRCYTRLPHEELVKVIGACRVGLCTSRMESQHLAGVEMGACGLPMVAPPVGVYWKSERFGLQVVEPSIQHFTTAIRSWLSGYRSSESIRMHWQSEFDKPIIKAQWTKLVEEVECSGQSA